MSEKKGFASWLFGKKKGAEEAPADEPGVERLGSPLAGTVIGIEQVSDQVFADKILGDGVAVIPADGKVYLFESKNFWFDPEPFLQDRPKIPVLVDRSDYYRYLVLTEGILPEEG